MIRPNFAVWSLAGVLLASGLSAVALAAEATAPASQPAEDIVLVRLGDKAVVTQAEFNSLFHSGPPVAFESSKDLLMLRLVEREWLQLYLQEHPDLVSPEALKAHTDYLRKREKLNTEEEFEAWLRRGGRTREQWDLHWRLVLGGSALSERGRQKARDEQYLKELFEADPDAFNGTEVVARHILIGAAPYETPAEKRAKREKAEKLRAGLVSGEITWDEALKQSTDQTRANGGRLPNFARHRLMEDLAAEAFKMKPGEISKVIETTLGFHILEVMGRVSSHRNFEESKREIKNWLEREAYIQAIDQMRAKYPIIGVQPPRDPGPRPAPATRPGGTSATTRPS